MAWLLVRSYSNHLTSRQVVQVMSVGNILNYSDVATPDVQDLYNEYVLSAHCGHTIYQIKTYGTQ